MSERTRAELIAWAAGIFEGEGCITQSRDVFTLRLNNTDQEVVERFADAVMLGTVYGPYSNAQRDGYRRKPFWVWVAQAGEASETLDVLAPWLSRRRLARARELGWFRFPMEMADQDTAV